MPANSLIYIVNGSILLVYGLLILSFFRGLKKKQAFADCTKKRPLVSVLVAYRDEYKNLSMLLNSIKNQHYPKKFFEIILVDDHSSDGGPALVKKFQLSFPEIMLKHIYSPRQKTGKKAALKLAYSLAKGEIILQTDADCILAPGWIASYVNAFCANEKLQFITGPVSFQREKGFLQHFYQYEFASLLASSAGSLGNGKPLMCNGANMGFRKSLLKENTGKRNEQFASGDDMFLMLAAQKLYGPSSISFLQNKRAKVFTRPPENFKTFMHQRIRWTSKAGAYKDLYIGCVSLLVFLTSLVQFGLGLSLFWSWKYLWVFAGFLLVKYIVDSLLTARWQSFVKGGFNPILFFIFELLYPFYVMGTGMLSLFLPFVWKGRKIRK